MLAVATVVALLLGASAVDTNVRVVSSDGEVGEESADQIPALRNVMRIICPFLSALVNEGVLEVKNSYTRDELMAITIQAGLDPEIAVGHTEGNFANNPSGEQDIFAMEGAANEHDTSTGIHDCPTLYYNCHNLTEDGKYTEIQSCQDLTVDCEVPSQPAFEQFWNDVNTDTQDCGMTLAEVNAYADGFQPPNTTAFHPMADYNPIARGTLAGSHFLILEVFGEGEPKCISKYNLFRLFIMRKFPKGYVFPSA
mmetsp:Transcript_58304/g.136317  ORF Transcript_58304/g.136317 Transcript_58304/m.136317 type:complete len:253 (+) Transcript_58304:122-880(+)|eukprot:4488361-Amphidinium_carterae.1